MITQRGSTAEHEASRRFKSEFLIHMDGLLSEEAEDQGQHVLVMATTNTPWDLDDALRRRLEKRIYVPLPDEAARTVIFQQRLDGVQVASDVDCAELAQWTHGYSGSDIHALCRDAAMAPLRRALDGKTPSEIKALRGSGLATQVEKADFEAAVRTIAPSVASGDVAKYEMWDAEMGTK